MRKYFLVLASLLILFSGCEKDGKVAEEHTLQVIGTVVSEADGKAIAKAEVFLGDRRAKTDSKGKFTFTEVKAGDYDLEVTVDSYEIYEDNVTVSGQSFCDLGEIALTPTSNSSNTELAAPTISVVATSSAISISWSKITGASSYKVYRRVSASSTFTILQTVSAVSYTDNSGTGGATYFYYVVATDGESESAKSNVASATMPTTSGEDEEEEEEEQQLDYPTNLSASQSGTSIVISWASVIGATGYMVYRSSNPYEPFEVLNSTSVASYTDNAPLSGYNYYKVTAKNSSSESEQSLYVSCNYSAPVTKPSAPTNVYAAQSGTSIVVSWSSVAGATSYRVYYSNDGISYGFFTPVTSTNLTDKSPYSGTNYYKVKAITSFGAESDYSTIASCTFSSAPSTPSTPTGLSAAANGYMITVRWNSVSGATYYKVAWSRTAAGTYTDLSPQYTVTSFTDDQQWNLGYNYYKVKACNASGCSSYSSYVSAYASNNSGGNEGGGTAYPAPTGVSMIYMGSYNIVSWNAASGATGYTVYRSNGNSGPWAEVEIIVGKTEYKDYGGSYSSCYKVGATYSSAIPSDLSKSSCD